MFGKRGALILTCLVVFLLLVVPLVSAKIVVINDFRDIYNFGETLVVDGYILAEKTTDGMVSLELQCPGYSKVNSVHLAINKNHMVRFSQLGIDTFTLPNTEGVCDVDVEFSDEGTNSESFTLLDDLLAAFDVGSEEYQLGEIFVLEGIVFKLDGSDVSTGDAQVFLEKKGEYPIQFGETTVSNGVMEFSKTLSNLDYGDYTIDVKVSDGLNAQYFDAVARFSVKTRFDVSVSTNKYTYEPTEEVLVKGQVDGLTTGDDVAVIISFDTLRFNTLLTGDSFEYSFFVPATLPAGSYKLKVKVSDIHGNVGEDSFDLTVEQIPVKIVNDIENDNFNPGETLTLAVQLLDQTSTTMTENVRVKITDPLGSELYNGEVTTRQEIELTFGQYARDGTYTIVSTYSEKNLDDTDRVTVNKVSGIDSEVDGRTVYIKNSGNVDYEDRVDIVLVSEKNGEKVYYVLAKDVALNPGDVDAFDLAVDVPRGEYMVLVDDSGVLSSLDDEDLASYIDGLVATSDEVFAGVDVDEDSREFGTKLNHGFSSVTGASTISAYDRTFTPWFFLLMVVLFGGLLGLYGYQRREVIKQKYKNYQVARKRKKVQEQSPIANIEHKGDGDVPKEEVDRLLARVHDKDLPIDKKINIGTDENRKVGSIKVKHVKPGTTTLIPRQDTIARNVVTEKTGRDRPRNSVRNRFSTWNPPPHAMDKFEPKNPVKLTEKKEKALYEDMDEDFLRDEKFE